MAAVPGRQSQPGNQREVIAKLIDPPCALNRALRSVQLGCVWALLLLLAVFVTGGCCHLRSVATDDSAICPTGAGSPRLPTGCEERMLSLLDVTRIVDIQKLGYSKKNYGQLLGVFATFEWRSGPERWYHRDYVLILGPGKTDWRQSTLYEISGPPDVDHPTFFQLFDLPQEELIKWLKEIPSL